MLNWTQSSVADKKIDIEIGVWVQHKMLDKHIGWRLNSIEIATAWKKLISKHTFNYKNSTNISITS